MARDTRETRFLLTAKDRTARVFKDTRKNISAIGGAVTGVQGKILALAGIGGIGVLFGRLVSVNREFQAMKASLKTVTGSTTAAAAEFKKIEKFATTTPYDLQQVTRAFIQMRALGLDASEAALRSYGNTASAMGKSLNQMVEAVADAATGEFERLKEFGIRASKNKDEVTFVFQGVEKTVKMTSANIVKYLQDIGNQNFGGAMADQMKNLDPAISNFGAAIDQLYVKVGEAGLNDALAEMINKTTAWIQSLDAAQVAEFTHEIINGFEGAVSAIRNLVQYWQTARDSIGWFFSAPEVDRIRAGGIGGGSAGYSLGDFNASSGRGRGIGAEQLQRAIEANTNALKDNTGAGAIAQ